MLECGPSCVGPACWEVGDHGREGCAGTRAPEGGGGDLGAAGAGGRVIGQGGHIERLRLLLCALLAVGV